MLSERQAPLTGVCEQDNQVITLAKDNSMSYHTTSSRYASAKSDRKSDPLIDIKCMSMGTTGEAFLRGAPSQLRLNRKRRIQVSSRNI